MRLARFGWLIATILFFLAVLTAVFQPALSFAQERHVIKAADTSSPRDTLRSFIDACNELHKIIEGERFFDRTAAAYSELGQNIIDCIDQSDLPAFAREQRAGEVAACLKEILDRVPLPPWEDIPDVDYIEKRGGLERFNRWRIPGTRITIARVDDGPQKHEYLFSTGTVDRAVDYFYQLESHPYRTDGPPISEGLFRWFISAPGHPAIAKIVGLLPERMQRSRTLGMASWKWPGLILALLISIGLMLAAYWLQVRITNRVRDKSVFKYCLTIVFPILAMLVPIGFKYVIERYITVRSTPLYYISFFANLTAVMAALVLLFAAAGRIAEGIIASPRINPQGLNAQFIRIVSTLTALVASVIVFLAGGQYLGIQLTTLLASAGVGGVALALGAQDSLKTLFGTLMLLADKPFRVGERILVEKYDGVVEDIGLRSTKMRLLTGHQVIIPNDQLARIDVENIGRRKYIRRKAEIHIPLDSASEKVEKALAIIREKLADHDGMDPEHPPRVFFDEFSADAFVLRFFYWYTPPNYWEFKAFGERLNLEIFHAFEEQGIQFSLPERLAMTTLDGLEAPFDVKRAEPWQGQDDSLDEM